MSDLRDLRARQQFLNEQISKNRAESKQKQDSRISVFNDPFFINRLVEHYETIYERKYTQLKLRLRMG